MLGKEMPNREREIRIVASPIAAREDKSLNGQGASRIELLGRRQVEREIPVHMFLRASQGGNVSHTLNALRVGNSITVV